ncbi:MAG TPA: hypothetical protein VJA87_02215 [Candidatus Paceibacterota bacterium]
MRQASATLLLLAAVFGIGFTSYAQLTGADPLILTVTPNYPRPFQSVTVVPESSVIDLSASNVTVSVNGQVISRGSGAEAAYVTTGGAGTATTVTVTATSGGQTYTKTVTLRPADVALVVEPVSSTHPLYEGGSLIAAEGQVRLVAVPDLRTSGGGSIPAANLIYTWRNGEQILQAASGIGKSVLTATSPVKYRDARITVTVSNQDRSIVAESTVLIAPANPLVRVYRNDPLLGPLYSTALPRNIELLGTEETFRAVPYFFAGTPAITWTVNNSTRDTDRDITVRSSGEGSGTALVRVFAGSGVESADASFAIDFGKDEGFNFFGL